MAALDGRVEVAQLHDEDLAQVANERQGAVDGHDGLAILVAEVRQTRVRLQRLQVLANGGDAQVEPAQARLQIARFDQRGDGEELRLHHRFPRQVAQQVHREDLPALFNQWMKYDHYYFF